MNRIWLKLFCLSGALILGNSCFASWPEGVDRQTISLDGVWELSYGPQTPKGPRSPSELAGAGWPKIQAAVPGNVELDLMKAGKLPNLELGTNIYRLRELEKNQWWYQRKFPTSKEPGAAHIDLVFEGIDCLGTIFLNGREIGQTHNMFIEHRFNVSELLRKDGTENELLIRLDSAVIEGRKHHPAALEIASMVNWESLSIRKAPHMYGWDNMPRIVSAGLWRSVFLEVVPETHWTEAYFGTLEADSTNHKATVLISWQFDTPRFDIDSWKVRASLKLGEKSIHNATYAVANPHDIQMLELTNVDLWWPRGYGSQPLYDLKLELLDEQAKVLDVWNQRVGIRTIKIVRSDLTTPEKPGEFVFVVNGEKIFVKGSNWVPLDGFHSRDKQRLDSTFAMVVDLNCNMLRCWGGNIYEDHDFFELCDRNGVMVWQDFAIACAIYPQTDTFAAEMREEAQSVVQKLRNHPSLALWAGGNELDETYRWWFQNNVDPNRDRITRQVLSDAAREHDPLREYLPGSPYRSPELVKGGNQDQFKPEDHLWNLHDFKGPAYAKTLAHFVSEIGYYGCPDRRSLEQMLEPAYLWPWQDNEQWLTHLTRPLPSFPYYNSRIFLRAEEVETLFGSAPTNLDDYILASQITQAEASKFFIEMFRCAKWQRTGILWWKLRDGWPAISEGIVDFYNRPKLAYNFIKEIQTDVCAMCGEPEAGRHSLVMVNDTLSEATGHVVVHDADSAQKLFESDYHVGRNGRALVGSIPQASTPMMWLIEWTAGGKQFKNHYLAGPRPFKLDDYKRWLKSLVAEGASYAHE